MTRFKDFGSGASNNAEPISFKLYDEEFHCVKSVQGKLMLELVADSSSGDALKSAQIINKFFKSILLDESYERFEALMDDKEKIVSVETLADITGWLIEEYSNRPEKQPEAS